MQVKYASQGFTLVELMISLVLGLIIIAAVMQVYLVNVKTSATQKSGGELQESSVFGIKQLEYKLRIANLGNPVTAINDTTRLGGVVLSLKNLGVPETDTRYLPYLTHSAGDTGFNSVSNVNESGSDQLTIQYINTSGATIYDCESDIVEPVSATSDKTNVHAIERYFLRRSTTAAEGLILVCDAGRIYDEEQTDESGNKTTTRTIINLSSNYQTGGEEFMAGVDQFKVLLGTQTTNSSPQLQYLSPNQYLALSQPRPAITHIKIGMIARGSTPVIGSDIQTAFNMLNKNYTLKSGSAKQVRQVYESNALLRNARVVIVE